MGTRALTFVYDGDKPIVNLYRQYDGYPTGHGAELAQFLDGFKIVNGIGAEKTLGYLEQRIKNEEAIVFIARVDGEAVGFTLLYPTFSTVSLSNIWLLNDLYVDESARGKGIASELMDVAESAAKSAGATRVFLRTANDNLPAQALYEGRNWVKDEVFRRYDLVF